ncbi:hypothetical protein Bbelb_338210 [Branchiostoma belcheri]|nr:hypothetical protein Bbelb_338210 [Branchiostoma belcheri]
MVLRRTCAVFGILGEEIADFLTRWILEKTRKWRPKDGGMVVGRAEFSQVSCVLRVCQLCKCSCPDEIRLVMAEAPGDRIQEYQARDHWDQENRSSQSRPYLLVTGPLTVTRLHLKPTTACLTVK